MPITIMTLTLAALLAQGQPDPTIAVERLGDNAYLLSVSLSDTASPAAAQALIMPRAIALCGDLPVRFGRFNFTANALASGTPDADQPDSVTLAQQVYCGDDAVPSANPSPPKPPPPLTEADAALLQPVIETLTDRYFAAYVDGRDAENHALASEGLTGGASVADLAARRKARLAETGAYVSRTVAKISWYSSPPDVDPGYYAAVDYVAGWERQDECGYIVWYSPDGVVPFLAVRQETTLLPHDLDATTVARLRRQYCILL